MSAALRMRRLRDRRKRGTWPVTFDVACRCIGTGVTPSSQCRAAQLGCVGWKLLSEGRITDEELADPDARAATLGSLFEELAGM